MSRPWSADEIAEKMQSQFDALEEAHHDLRELGRNASHLKWEYRRQEALARRTPNVRQGSNKEERDAAVFLYQIRPGYTLADLGEERDIAEAAYDAQAKVLYAMQEQSKLITSLHVTSREVSP